MSHLTSLLNFSGSNYSCKTFGKTEVLTLYYSGKYRDLPTGNTEMVRFTDKQLQQLAIGYTDADKLVRKV